MDNVRTLKLAQKDQPSNELVMKKYDERVEEVRKFLKDNINCGFAIVGYAKEDRGTLNTFATYFVDDPLDAYSLPEMAKARIINVRDSQTDL